MKPKNRRMAKSSPAAAKKRPARILGIRPWLLIVGGLSLAATHAIAKAKHRRLAAVDNGVKSEREPSQATSPDSTKAGESDQD